MKIDNRTHDKISHLIGVGDKYRYVCDSNGNDINEIVEVIDVTYKLSNIVIKTKNGEIISPSVGSLEPIKNIYWS